MPGDKTNTTFPIVNETFNSDDAEITFQSSDNILFKIHRKSLEAGTGALSPDTFSTSDSKVVPLTEDAATLELLFQYTYPGRHPLLDDIQFSLLDSLAEAAEKYEVSAARSVCHIRMSLARREHPAEILRYAAKHDYPKLLSDAAALAIGLPLLNVVSVLPPHLILTWHKYYEEWHKVHTAAFSRAISHGENRENNACKSWAPHLSKIIIKLGSGVTVLAKVDSLFENSECGFMYACCANAMSRLAQDIKADITKIPSFSTFY